MNETLESTATQHTLLNLRSGRLYNVTMVTEAGDLQSSVAIEAQTGREEEEESGRKEDTDLTCECLCSSRRGCKRDRRLQRHQPVAVMATA